MEELNLVENPMGEILNAPNEKDRFFATWLWRLFWVNIACMVLRLLLPEPYGTGLASLVLYFTVTKLGTREDSFRMAAIFGWSMAIIENVVLLMHLEDSDTIRLLAELVTAVLALCYCYHLYQGYIHVTGPLAPHMAQKWQKFWSAVLIVNGGLVLCALLLLIPFINVIAIYAVFGFTIAAVVVAVMELVYLYQSAKALDAAVQM